MAKHTSQYILMLIALLAWSALLMFTRFVPPQNPLAFLAFFVIIGIALTSTFTPIAYFIGMRLLPARIYRATTYPALRQGLLLSLAIILNLILLALHSWNIFMALVILVVAVITEILFLARK